MTFTSSPSSLLAHSLFCFSAHAPLGHPKGTNRNSCGYIKKLTNESTVVDLTQWTVANAKRSPNEEIQDVRHYHEISATNAYILAHIVRVRTEKDRHVAAFFLTCYDSRIVFRDGVPQLRSIYTDMKNHWILGG